MAENVALLTDLEEVSLYDDSSLRIILVGKTGAGKSSTGNTILRHDVFHAEMAGNCVTRVCQKFNEKIGKKRISVIDTPGFCGSLTTKDMTLQLEECVNLSVPGPHAFLLVVQVGRFTEEEQNAVTYIEKSFGKEALKYTIVLFTHVDQLKRKPLTSYIEETKALRDLIRSCGGRYHQFNNEDTEDRSQVTQLLKMISRMVADNKETYYSNVMFEKAQKEKKFKEKCHKAKDIASVAGLVMVGAVGVGAVCSGVGAVVGLGIAGLAAVDLGMGAAIGAGVAGGTGGLAGGIAGGVAGAKPEATKHKKSD